jgi:hypothetical protein
MIRAAARTLAWSQKADSLVVYAVFVHLERIAVNCMRSWSSGLCSFASSFYVLDFVPSPMSYCVVSDLRRAIVAPPSIEQACFAIDQTARVLFLRGSVIA